MGLEQRLLAGGDPLLGELDQRAHVAVQLVLGAVVGVEGDVDRVLGRDHVGELGQGDRAGDHVLEPLAGQERRPAGRDLDDAVAAGLGVTADGRVQALRGGHVDGRVGEAALLARSSISLYTSGVAMGMVTLLLRVPACGGNSIVPTPSVPTP